VVGTEAPPRLQCRPRMVPRSGLRHSPRHDRNVATVATRVNGPLMAFTAC
jgi:hypothetical protein